MSLQITSADTGIMFFVRLSRSFVPAGEHRSAGNVLADLELHSVKGRVQVAAAASERTKGAVGKGTRF